MKHWYVADFETTGEDFYNTNGYTKVWLYGICDDDGVIMDIGENIDSFMATAKRLAGSIIYFHNLKFDGTFIIDWLLNHGYSHVDQVKDQEKTFSTLIDDLGAWYTISVQFKKGKRIRFYDSLKVLPFKVEKLAKDFGMDILKEKIDYHNYNPTSMSYIYQIHDIQIVAHALKAVKAEGMTKLTTAGCAYSNYSSDRGDLYMQTYFPSLTLDFLQTFRSAYRGGRSQVNPIYQGMILHDVKRYDVNSMYPSIMRNEFLPYGEPIPISQRGLYKFELYHIIIDFSLKEGHLPSLLKKGNIFTDNTYWIDTDGLVDIYISNIDLELVYRHYDVHGIKFLEMYGFLTARGMFANYIDYWYEKKKVDKGAPRLVDKLMLNSLYGKFGSNPVGKKKEPVLGDDGVVEYKPTEEEEMKHYYLPVAIAITSLAHLLIDDAIEDVGVENFVYCDTDSVHTIGEMSPWNVDQTELGKFKLEGVETTSKYIRQKCYIYKENDKMTITCAGLTDDMKQHAIELYGDDLFNKFHSGFTIGGKLIPKHVKGGTILCETNFTIK